MDKDLLLKNTEKKSEMKLNTIATTHSPYTAKDVVDIEQWTKR